MKYKSLILLIILSLSLSNVTAENFLNKENLINNGGFELKKSHRWIIKGNAQITSKISYKGEYSIKLSNNSSSPAYIFQHFEHPIKNFNASFWFYLESKPVRNSIEFVSDWDKKGLNSILKISFADDSITISSFDTTVTKRLKLDSDDWHKVSIETDSAGLKKTIFLNDDLICSFASIDVSVIETLIIGDISGDLSGTIYFDEIMIFENSKIAHNSVSPGIFGSVGLGRTFVGPTFYFSVSYSSNNNLFSFRYLKGDELQLSFADPVYKPPNEKIQEFTLLYGREFRKGTGAVSFAAGIGYIYAIRRGENSEKIEISEIGLSLDGKFLIIISKYWGLGVAIFSNINQQKSVYGASLNVYFGNI
jgi:hypothetical protein